MADWGRNDAERLGRIENTLKNIENLLKKLVNHPPLHCTAFAEDGGCGREDCPRCGRPTHIDGRGDD